MRGSEWPLIRRIDRVFSHALNTVNKIRTGSQKPPSATRLRLYGLYKQAMGAQCQQEARDKTRLTRTEGDVDGIMDRPEGDSEQDQRAREKWYARDLPSMLGCHAYSRRGAD